MMTALISNLGLASEGWGYSALLALQLGFYLVAGLTWLTRAQLKGALLKIPTSFVAVNVAIGLVWWQYFCGQRMVMWPPSQR